MRWSGPGRGRWARVVAVAGVALAVGGCIGTTDREEFDEVIQERGGGLTSELVLDAVDVVAADVGAADFDIRSLTVNASAQLVVLDVRDPAVPENLDQYTVRGGDIETVEPIRLSASDDLDQLTFPVSDLALDRVEAMVDQALAAFGRDDGFASSMTVSGFGDAGPTILLSLESSRIAGNAEFTAGGELIEVTET